MLDVISIRGLVWGLSSEGDGVGRETSSGDGGGEHGGDEGEGGEQKKKTHGGWWRRKGRRDAGAAFPSVLGAESGGIE